MTDLERAKELLASGCYTCVLVYGSEVYSSGERGVAPLLKFINSGKDFSSFCAADKVVGKAAALLYVYMGIKELYAGTISDGAEKILKKYNIAFKYDKLVPNIINRAGNDICPMEKAVADIDTAEEAVLRIKEKLSQLQGILNTG